MNRKTSKSKFLKALMIAILLTLFCITLFYLPHPMTDNNGVIESGTTPVISHSPTADLSAAVSPQILTRDYLFLREPVSASAYGDYYAVCDKTGADEYSIIVADKNGVVISRADNVADVAKIVIADDKSVIYSGGGKLTALTFDTAGGFTADDLTSYFPDGIFDIFSDNGVIFVQDYNNSVYKLTPNADGYVTQQIDLQKPYVANSIVRSCGGKFYSYRYTDETVYELTQNAAATEYIKIAEGVTDISDYGVLNGAAIILNRQRNKITAGGNALESAAAMSIALGADKIVITDTKARNLTVCDEELTPLDIFGSKSAESGKLDAPESEAIYDGGVLIADTGNSRVARYGSDGVLTAEYALEQQPKNIAAFKNGFYINDGINVYKYVYNDAGGVSSIGEPIAINGALDIAVWDNGLIALKSNGEIYDYSSGKTLFTASGATKIVVNAQTNILYATGAAKLTRYNLGNNSSLEEFTCAVNGFVDFTVDYSGKIYAFFADKIECYATDKSRGALNLINSYELTGVSGVYSAVQSSGGDVYIADKDMHAFMKIGGGEIGAYSVYDYAVPEEWNTVRGAVYNDGALLYAVPGNGETASNAQAGARFLCLAEEIADGIKYYYGTDIASGGFCFAKAEDLTLAEYHAYGNSEPKYNSILAVGVEVYEYPFNDAKLQNKVGFGTLFTLIENLGGDKDDLSWGWYKVSYEVDGKEYRGYVKNIEISTFTPLLPPAKQEYYKVKADSVGTTVNVYAEPSADSGVLFTLNDGESVIITSDQYDPASEFTKIYVNGHYGYIRTANLQKDGLTTVEITAVIVGSICGAALLGTIPLFVILYKKHRVRKTRDGDI